MKTRLDVVTRALRRLGVAAHDEAPTADQIESVGSVYDALLAEITETAGESIANNSVPEMVFIPLANLLAVEIAPDYGTPLPQSRGSAMLRLLAVMRPDDRTDIPAPEYY